MEERQECSRRRFCAWAQMGDNRTHKHEKLDLIKAEILIELDPQ
jgi:hypothetical protein